MISCKCIISYPALFEPKPNPSGVLKYSCSLLIPKSDVAGVQAFKSEVEKAAARGLEKLWKNKLPKFRYEPLRDGDQELKDGDKTDDVYRGMYFINCSSNTAPGVIGPDGGVIVDPESIFPGCFVRAEVNPFPYSQKGNKGIGWGLNNVMLLGPGPRLDGRRSAADAFSEVPKADISEEEANAPHTENGLL